MKNLYEVNIIYKTKDKTIILIYVSTMSEVIPKKKLNDEQKDAVKYNGKSLLISAGPGAGKTFVLIERIKYLLREKNVNPESILVITFTRKAADQLRQRLSKDDEIDEGTVNKMFINTIHSFCINFLSENGCSDINLLESENNNERKLMFLRKHKKDLGFTREAHMSGKNLHAVVDKFNEYTTFNVKTPELVEYIRENRPVSQEYKDLIASCGEGDDFEYPYDEVRNDEELRESQYNARYLAIAKAYPEYINLLEQETSYDFNYLQVKVMDILKNNESIAKNSRFKNILIDEYQDIDPIQNNIFTALSKYSDSFTVVGDDDQSIYAFRGSVPKYFTDFADNISKENNPHKSSVKKLSTNFRSCPEVVEYNEELICDDREIEKNLIPDREDKGGVYYLINDDNKTQAEKIAKIILHLRQSDKIKQYSDVALLVSSVKYSKGINEILETFNNCNIPYNLSENESLMSNPEVKAMIILLWYMKEDSDKIILSSWEKDWLNLSAFSQVQDILNLDDTTCQILADIEERYQENILEAEKEVYKELTGKTSRLKTFKGVFNRDDEIVEEVLNKVERFDLSSKTRNDLEELGITNKHDLDLFENLYNIKEKLYDANTEFYEKPSILEIYYDILQYSGILENRLENPTEDNERILRNLGQITETISNYEEIVTKYSINGLLWFIFQEFDNYATSTIESDSIDKVQIMTVHKSKGLEFPVVIIGSIMEDKFPKHTDICVEAEKNYVHGSPTYYTPLEYLEYKQKAYHIENDTVTEDDVIEEENKEAKRVFYVATTRAEDILILSSIKDNEGNVPKIMESTIDDDRYQEITDNYNDLVETQAKEKEPEKERLKLSYTHLSEYDNCAQEYNLRYNYQFKNSKNKALTFGQVAHTILNLIHQKQIRYQKEGQGQVTSNEEIKEIIEQVKLFNQNLENNENDEFKEIEQSIYTYWNENKDKYEIIGSEVPFSITYDDYDLEGKIDLIVKDKNSDDITIIDFKTTNERNSQILTDRYHKQLFTYAMAIRKLPEYDKYNIKEVMIYSVKYSQAIPIAITDLNITDVEKSINNTVDKILDGNFIMCSDDSRCFNCEYNKSICRRK